jgi:hypothetical protein
MSDESAISLREPGGRGGLVPLRTAFIFQVASMSSVYEGILTFHSTHLTAAAIMAAAVTFAASVKFLDKAISK